jgi:hypothetical protein
MLLATAPVEIDVSADEFLPDRWIIATANVWVTQKGAQLAVPTRSSDRSIALVADSG